MSLDKVVQIFSSVGQNIDDDMAEFTPLKNLCDKFGLKPSYIVIPFIVLSLLLSLFGLFGHIFVTIFGMLYPGYMSFKVPLHLCRQSIKTLSKNLSSGSLTG
jgi:hypothetical protein